jgi:hypothetical protein
MFVLQILASKSRRATILGGSRKNSQNPIRYQNLAFTIKEA